MHELALVSALIDAITEDANQRGIERITYFRLSVGELSGAGVSSLDFALRHLTTGTVLEEAGFDIEVVAPRGECKKCRKVFKPAAPFFACPACGSGQSVITDGTRVCIKYYEGE